MSTEAADTVTLTRAGYEALLSRLEDAEDNAAVDRLEARIEAGVCGGDRRLSAERTVARLVAGEHPIRVWRAHRGLTREAVRCLPWRLSELSQRDRDRGANPAA